jgi:lipopolysaccharide/colanic/teichoic acid biosynthesis glycosyltransferase
MYSCFFKHIIDFVAALIGIILLSPVFLIITLLMFFVNRGKPFFTQPRPGKNGKIFQVIKFKTMNDKKDSEGNLLPDVERLTKTGKLIRQTSLDEIPQLLNVLKGDMSLVGPRPLLVEYLPLYNETQLRRHRVQPGITGWAQVNGRNAISWEEKFHLDVWYVDHLSFGLDSRIIWITLLKIFRMEGINYSSEITMERFTGNK